jgi:hypothetical protein
MIVNAARASKKLSSSDELVTQKGLLEKVKLEIWNQGVGISGRGIALDDYGALIEASLKAYGFSKAQVVTVHADDQAGFKKRIHQDLLLNEKSAQTFMIGNFLQSEFTGDPDGAVGHYAPISAFDAKEKRVLIFDPDRQYYEPYWVSESTLIKGMNTLDPANKKTRGYLFIHLNESP